MTSSQTPGARLPFAGVTEGETVGRGPIPSACGQPVRKALRAGIPGRGVRTGRRAANGRMQSDLCRSRQKRKRADMTAMRFVVFGSGNVRRQPPFDGGLGGGFDGLPAFYLYIN